ncbi:hypothetical protein EDC01DRAFT_420903 [Geopyxis carbonaria]|nr:hypothetical protein EDC01DRAFT_420903 [Geopyxis carbonaria]
MATYKHQPPTLVPLWLTISTLIVCWDISYCLLRPASMPGGRYHFLYTPYALYAQIDYIYGPQALAENNGFTGAQAWMNVVESLLNLCYASQYWRGKRDGKMALLGLVAVSMTWSKTCLYALNEACSGWKGIGHNDAYTLLTLYVIPNGLWIVMPAYCGWYFWSELAGALDSAKVEGEKKKLK